MQATAQSSHEPLNHPVATGSRQHASRPTSAPSTLASQDASSLAYMTDSLVDRAKDNVGQDHAEEEATCAKEGKGYMCQRG